MFSPRFLFSTYTLIAVTAVVLLTGNRENSLPDTPSYTPDKTYRITLLQTNDIQVERFHSSNSLEMAERKALIDGIRKEVKGNGGQVVLLSGGDISASIENSDVSNLDELNYTAMTVGRHQFDYPLDSIRKQQSDAEFPLISANIFESETGNPLFDAYKLVNVDGLNIAIIGLTEAYSPKAQHSNNLVGIEFMDPFEIASELAPMLKEQADIVIASTHLGHNSLDGVSSPDTGLSSIEELDLVLGDHTQGEPSESDHSNCGWFLTRTDLEFKNGTLKIISSEKLAMSSSVLIGAQDQVASAL